MDNDLEIIKTPTVLARTELDSAIVTAKQYPRQIAKVKADIESMATLDEETAASCFYTLPRGGKSIQGPSVRLAEIALSCYQNINAGSRAVHVETGDNPHVVIEAVCHDMQNNVRVTIQKRRRIVGKKPKDGQPAKIDEDDINLAVNAGSAIALRDAVFKVIPGTLIKPALDRAKQVAVGEVKSIVTKRQQVIDRLNKMGVTLDRILAVLEVKAQDDIQKTELETLIGLGTSIKDGTLSVEEAFPLIQKEAPKADPTTAKKGDKTTVAIPKAKAPAPAPTEPLVTRTHSDVIAEMLNNTPHTIDDLLGLCMNTPTLKVNAEKWTSLIDIDDADATYIIAHLDVSKPTLTWKE